MGHAVRERARLLLAGLAGAKRCVVGCNLCLMEAGAGHWLSGSIHHVLDVWSSNGSVVGKVVDRSRNERRQQSLGRDRRRARGHVLSDADVRGELVNLERFAEPV